MTDSLIAPHGGELILNMASETEQAALLEQAKTLSTNHDWFAPTGRPGNAGNWCLQPPAWLYEHRLTIWV